MIEDVLVFSKLEKIKLEYIMGVKYKITKINKISIEHPPVRNLCQYTIYSSQCCLWWKIYKTIYKLYTLHDTRLILTEDNWTEYSKVGSTIYSN
jgi:hypothetical protein